MAANSTHPIKGVVILPAVVVAIIALSIRGPSFTIICQDKDGVGGGDVMTHDLLKMALTEQSICDLDSRGGRGHSF